VNLHALGEQIGGRLISSLVDHGKNAARGPDGRFLAGDQLRDHFFHRHLVFAFLNHCQPGEFAEGAGGGNAQRTNALGDQVEGIPFFRLASEMCSCRR